MILMPPQHLTSPLASKISRLDTEIKTILDNPNIDDETKTSAYSQVLSRYLSARQQYSRPTPVPVVDVPPSKDDLGEIQLDAVPKQYAKKAQLLVDHIRRSPGIGWNQRNELVVEGATVPNSNIIDLVGDLVRPKTNFSPRGVGDFVRVLKQTNVPVSLINNRDRWLDHESDLHRRASRRQSSPIADDRVPTTPSPAAKRYKSRRMTTLQSGEGIKWSKW